MASPGCRAVIVPLEGNRVGRLRDVRGLEKFLEGRGGGVDHGAKSYELLSGAA